MTFTFDCQPTQTTDEILEYRSCLGPDQFNITILQKTPKDKEKNGYIFLEFDPVSMIPYQIEDCLFTFECDKIEKKLTIDPKKSGYGYEGRLLFLPIGDTPTPEKEEIADFCRQILVSGKSTLTITFYEKEK